MSSILLKKFGETLTGGALTWYSQLPARSIETFEDMADTCVTAHAGAKKDEARVNDIFVVKQSLGEVLRDFLARFNRVRMTLPNMSKRMTVTDFQNRLSRDGSRTTTNLLSRLMKYLPTTWDKIHNAYCAKIGADEDDLNGPTHHRYKPNPEKNEDTTSGGITRSHGQTWNDTSHTPGRPPYLPSALKKAHLGRERELTGMREECGHKTEDSITLRQEVVNMLRQGHLKELLSDKGRNNFARGREHQGQSKHPSLARTINMMVGRGGDASINSVKFTTTHKLKWSITREQYD
ncbi:uncharacterized protein LOC142166976 [Nicotiana tabacum]|uniref:Uncharacterized protein LOC142166976 n=1 Tax=Nicotiana tabacum TaxID=4097 RepID=A0AC58SE04_TOBAC